MFFKHVKKNNVSQVLQMLLKNGKLVNELDEAGRIPMHWACENGALSIVEILLDFGSSILLSDYVCQDSPLDLAFKYQ